MLLVDKGNIVAQGTPEEMRTNTHPRVRQFLDRVAEPEVAQEMDYLQMLTGGTTSTGQLAGRRRGV
jgi:phospholipid/cholesterol/gamma-HCH transport system ATP-binding protein